MKLKRIRGDAIRGGAWVAWVNDDRDARCACRLRGNLGLRNRGLSFRCCFSPFFVKINKEKLEK